MAHHTDFLTKYWLHMLNYRQLHDFWSAAKAGGIVALSSAT